MNMRVGSGGGSSRGSDVKKFPVGKMLTTAGNMITNANNALAEHERAWARIQTYIDSFPGFMQPPVRAVLSAYEKRLRASYQWQIDAATDVVKSSTTKGSR
jgi:hypothetical protein